MFKKERKKRKNINKDIPEDIVIVKIVKIWNRIIVKKVALIARS